MLSDYEKKLMGKIGVDSGVIWIGDPCYLKHHKPEKFYQSLEHDEFYKSFNHPLDHEGLGILASSFEGDGFYPVYGLFKKDDPRPRKIIIDFEENKEHAE